MACVLLVDPSEVARRAMGGILVRAGHRMAAVSTPREAWEFVNTHVRVDLVFTELKLKEGSGIGLIQQLKSDPFLKLLPVVVYTEHSDRDSVKQALTLRVQNVLIKPYHDDAIYAEIAKTVANPWRNRHFEEEKSFCKQVGYTTEELRAMLDRLRQQLMTDSAILAEGAQNQQRSTVQERLNALSSQAETSGAWGVVDYLTELGRLVESDNWAGFQNRLDGYKVAVAIINQHLNQSFMPEPYQTKQELNGAAEERNRALWFKAPEEGRCPVTNFEELKVLIDQLPGAPVIESAVAAFQMTANGDPATMNPLMDIVARDPGLTAQMLISASKLRRAEDFDPLPLEDSRLAVGRLGELRLSEMAKTLVSVEERHLNLPPHFNWPQYWIFLMGVARVSRFTCEYLERPSMELQARMAGLLHDLGRLILAKLHPYAFEATLQYARERRVPLIEAEQLFLGCTTHDLAAYFGEKNNMAAPYVAVMRWLHKPEEAKEHRDLVAIVALARDLCRQNQLGISGDAQLEDAVPLDETAEWRVLREGVFPSFDMRKFELKVHASCLEMRQQLQGQFRS